MYNLIRFFQKSLAAKLVLVAGIVIVLLYAGNMLLQLRSAKSASESAIAQYGINLAKSYAGQMNVQPYAEFLKNPGENDNYWAIREELNRYRKQIGALYVYVVKINEKREPLMMIDGQPKDSDSASPINEVTDIPAAAIDQLLKGEAAHSPLIQNPEYGTYISAYAPVKDAQGKMIGVLGIDTEATVIDRISGDILRSNVLYYAGLAVLTLLALFLIAWFIAVALRPLRHLVLATENIAAGKLAEANEILSMHAVRSLDEIGSAYQSTKKMSDHLNALMAAVSSNVLGTSEQLAASMDVFVRQSEELVQLNQTVSSTAQKVDEGAQTQQQSAVESARSMEEITLSIGRVSEAAANVSEASREALDSAESGKDVILLMRRQIETIASSAGDTQELVEALGTYSRQIGEVLNIIVDIAEQTKLLALNASIEAARAGEHGSGFAVVAGEVRKLAELSSSSSSKIASLLTNIQKVSGEISHTMAAGSKEINEGVELSGQVEETFGSVVRLFRYVTEQIQEISASSEQISASSQTVAASVEEIASIARVSSGDTHEIHLLADQQLQAARQIAASAGQLSGMSHEMRIAVQKISI
ncbi:methyl-accepting chemotaxis protein [Paenibacillus hamazuiensis]|uniref:methyl-accepting chemotaxis protein n=1 Tax=Paenibacillus hamazuiensis TaxID=2936508 RepID=UPI00200E0F2A